MVNIDDVKSLPSNMEAEKEFLSILFIEPSLTAISIIKSKHFTITEFAKIYKAMQSIYNAWEEITVVSVSDKTWVDTQFLRDVASYAMTTTAFDTDQKIILDHYNRRKIIRWAKDILSVAYDMEHSVDDILAQANMLGSDTDTMDETKTLVKGSLDTIMRYFDSKEQPAILEDTWYSALTWCLWWWRAWALYVLAWATSQWKSTFALNLCIEALKRWTKCSFFSTEMPAKEIHTRFISREAKVPSWMIEKWVGDIADKVTETISNISSWVADCNIYDTFSTVENLERLIVKEASLGSKIVFIDYLQQVRVKWNNRNLAIGDMTTMLKGLAMRYGIAIIALSQLNRASQDNTWWPQLRDLRDSGSIEQDADSVIFVHWYDAHALPPTVWLYVKKNRHWELLETHIPFDKRYFLFPSC